MATGEDVGIHADGGGSRSGAARNSFGGFVEQNVEFGLGFDVEKKDAGSARAGVTIMERFANFFARFSGPGKNDTTARDADAGETLKFTGGDNVETAAKSRKEPEDGKVRVGFYGVAKSVRKAAKCAVEKAIGRFHGRLAVNVSRRSGGSRDAAKRHIFTEKLRRAGHARSWRVTLGIKRRGQSVVDGSIDT